ncbi:hypothetical protein EU538_12605 [Candidatus Thorarchaeota archaeon]|nr:MAG: hypothetical protein EU538_12605 [Candidatus Thorarchaeota archaeon]
MDSDEENRSRVIRYLVAGVLIALFLVVFTLIFVGSPLEHPLEFLAIAVGFLIYGAFMTLCDSACCGSDSSPRPLAYDDGGRAPNKLPSHTSAVKS